MSNSSFTENIHELNDIEMDTVAGGTEYVMYTVRKGDTISHIARFYNTTPELILALNPFLTDENSIRTGFNLLIPRNR